jgi:hypothetical protein
MPPSVTVRTRPDPKPEREVRREQESCCARKEEHADEVVAAYLAGIRSDDPNRAYRAADAWISRVLAGAPRWQGSARWSKEGDDVVEARHRDPAVGLFY